MTRRIALIRGIGPSTHSRVSVADLRAGCAHAGLRDVRTLLATGDVAFDADTDTAEGEVAAHVAAVLGAHGLFDAVVARRAADLPAILDAIPIPDAAAARPHHLLTHFLPEAWTGASPEWAGPERVALRGREVFVGHADGVGRSRLTIGVLHRLVGPNGTARNRNTATNLGGVLGLGVGRMTDRWGDRGRRRARGRAPVRPSAPGRPATARGRRQAAPAPGHAP